MRLGRQRMVVVIAPAPMRVAVVVGVAWIVAGRLIPLIGRRRGILRLRRNVLAQRCRALGARVERRYRASKTGYRTEDPKCSHVRTVAAPCLGWSSQQSDKFSAAVTALHETLAANAIGGAAALAEKLGVPTVVLQDWLTGASEPPTAIYVRALDVLIAAPKQKSR